MPIYIDDGRCHFCGSDFTALQGRTIARMCGECGHVWETLTDLVEHDYKLQVEMSRADPIEFWSEVSDVPPKRRLVKEMWSCPCCGYDF